MRRGGRGGGRSAIPAALAGFPSEVENSRTWEFSMERLLPRPSSPTDIAIEPKELRIPGETWVLHFRTTRKSDGRRVENKIPIGLVRDLPDKRTAWAEVERLHLPINPVDSRRGATFGDLVLHYAEHELVERSESIDPKAHTTIKGYIRFLRNDFLPECA